MIPAKAAILLSITAATALAGCAGQRDLYPSLSIRDAERVSGTFKPVEPDAFVSPPPSADVLGQIGAMRALAQRANERFLAAAQRARGTVAAARGAQPGSEKWSVAQVALADIESSRSDAMIALAELDRLYVDAYLEASELDQIVAERDEVSALVASQDQLIDTLHSDLGE